MKVVIITQARLGSTRLPGKVLLPLMQSQTVLDLHLQRLKSCVKANEVVLATTHESGIESVLKIAQRNGVRCFQGSSEDVLDRFYKAALMSEATVIVRVTSDCPLIDPELVDDLIAKFLDSKVDYASNWMEPNLPDGFDAEIFTFSALKLAWVNAKLLSEREHVSPYIWKNTDIKGGKMFKGLSVVYGRNLQGHRVTLDYPKDLEVIRAIIDSCGADVSLFQVIKFFEENPSVNELNSKYGFNEGYQVSLKKDKCMLRKITNFKKSDEYRETIHSLIPGGAHTYSKGDDQFPVRSPAAIAKGKGSQLWDIDGNQYLDCAMGLSSISLGHAYEPILAAVREELENGVNFQRPSYIEKEMAEKFLSLVPGHQMIKFAKNGSTATTAAVKLARAYTNRELVAFPSDHPFYSYDDWFIGKTACARGVPSSVKELGVTFSSTDLSTLEALFVNNPGRIACVISEPERTYKFDDNYLERIVEICHKHGALFIQDEMITGFRVAFPGVVAKSGIVPDLITWGKGIANGFSFCALTGKREIMELGGIKNKGQEKLFLISTTHGGETHAIAAGLATINEFQNKDVIGHIHRLGKRVWLETKKLILEKKLENFIDVSETDWTQAFSFKNINGAADLGLKTLFMQEMIARGVLFQGLYIPCFSHSDADVDYFLEAFSESCDVYEKALTEGFQKYLIGPPLNPVFRNIV